MTARHSIPANYRYHRPLLSDVLPFEVPPTFSNTGFFDFVTRYNVRLKRTKDDWHVVWEARSSKFDEVIEVLFQTCKKPAANRMLTKQDSKIFANPTSRRTTKNGKVIYERCWKLLYTAMRTRAYGFDIAHKEREFRRLSVVHPRNQLAVADFYSKNHQQIRYYTGLSQVSIRHPAAVAKTVRFSDRLFEERRSSIPDTVEQHSKEYENIGSFFSYRYYSNIFKFFEHYKYHNAEKKFDLLLRLDISKCFDSIYTHSLPWCTLGTQASKDYIRRSGKTFGGRFDRLLQEMNQGETNGIVIGPEFSRIFAEIILQRVDQTFLGAMFKKHELTNGSDFRAYRYVDDYFIFCSADVDLNVVERELGLALKEVKLSVNSSKSEVICKPIITKLTVAKNRIRKIFKDCIEVREEEVEWPKGSGDFVLNFDPVVRLNKLIVEFKSVLLETGVEYKNILNYSFAAIERGTSKIFAKFRKSNLDLRDERKLVRAILGVLEFSFFVYAADPRVNISIRLSRLISHIVDEMNAARVVRDNKSQVLKYIFDNTTRQLMKSSAKGGPNVEVLYLVLALRKLGREFLVDENILACYLGFSRDGGTGKYKSEYRVDYFTTTVGLSYVRGMKRYSDLRMALEENLVQRLLKRKAYVQNDSEAIMTYLDIACCPFVSDQTKSKVSGIFGHSILQLRSLQGAASFWFTDWKGFDLSLALDKKRAREVY